MLITPIVNRI